MFHIQLSTNVLPKKKKKLGTNDEGTNLLFLKTRVAFDLIITLGPLHIQLATLIKTNLKLLAGSSPVLI